MKPFKYYFYIFLATVFGACFMWLAFICLQIGLYMITDNWKPENNLARYVDGGIVIFGAIVGFLNGQRWWILLYEKNGTLKETYRGWQSLRLRLRAIGKFLLQYDSN